jgi:hypothetical protein
MEIDLDIVGELSDGDGTMIVRAEKNFPIKHKLLRGCTIAELNCLITLPLMSRSMNYFDS